MADNRRVNGELWPGFRPDEFYCEAEIPGLGRTRCLRQCAECAARERLPPVDPA